MLQSYLFYRKHLESIGCSGDILGKPEKKAVNQVKNLINCLFLSYFTL